jgi:hypothetical protein
VSCPRCFGDTDPAPGAPWCDVCELEYAQFVRDHAADIVAPLLFTMLIMTTGGLIVPILGGSIGFAALGVFAGFGSLVGLTQLRRKRRRRQFLRAALPQARLTSG